MSEQLSGHNQISTLVALPRYRNRCQIRENRLQNHMIQYLFPFKQGNLFYVLKVPLPHTQFHVIPNSLKCLSKVPVITIENRTAPHLFSSSKIWNISSKPSRNGLQWDTHISLPIVLLLKAICCSLRNVFIPY